MRSVMRSARRIALDMANDELVGMQGGAEWLDRLAERIEQANERAARAWRIESASAPLPSFPGAVMVAAYRGKHAVAIASGVDLTEAISELRARVRTELGYERAERERSSR